MLPVPELGVVGGLVQLAPTLAPWAVVALLIVVALKAWQPFQTMRNSKEESEVVRLTERVLMLESEVAQLQAQLRVLAHAWGNESATLDAVLLIAKTNPSGLIEAIPEIEKARARKRLELAAEKGAIAGARIAAAGHPGDKGTQGAS